MAAYSDFAEVYDALMDDVDYAGWADYYLGLVARAGVAPARMCDCACGTGGLTVQFAARGLRVIGVDASGQMLRQAQARSRRLGVQAVFARQDMRALELPRPVDALVCGCDGVNYLLDDDGLNAFFARARESIRPGGALAFDISSAWKLEHVLGDGFFGEEREDVAYLWSNRFDAAARTSTMDLTFFVREADGRYRRFNEVHTQRAHEAAHLVERLEANGFGRVEVFGDRTLAAPGPEERRIHFLAVRK